MGTWQSFFRGKRVTVMGLGVLGRGVGDAAFLAQHCAEVVVTDLKDERALAPSVARLRPYHNVRFVLGRHEFSDFVGRDFILKAAGVPLDSPYLAHAARSGVPVEMSTALFVSLARLPTIGITGTRGKSTTTHLIAHTLQEAGVATLLGGNVVGVSTLALLPEAHRYTLAVLELDSWQLQGFGERQISPDIAVFTSFMEDHQNYYPSLARYFADKAHIFMHQRKGGVLVAPPEVVATIGAYGYARRVPSRVVFAQATERVPPTPHLIGDHFRVSAACAYEALRVWGLSHDAIARGFASFPGVPGRLEYLGVRDGVHYYNDTTATTPHAARAALQALAHRHGGIVAIMGGADKDISDDAYRDLAAQAGAEGVRVVLLPGSATGRLRHHLHEAGVAIVGEAVTMKEAVTLARHEAREGEAVVLTPACASFGLFAHEYDRGSQFCEAVAIKR